MILGAGRLHAEITNLVTELQTLGALYRYRHPDLDLGHDVTETGDADPVGGSVINADAIEIRDALRLATKSVLDAQGAVTRANRALRGAGQRGRPVEWSHHDLVSGRLCTTTEIEDLRKRRDARLGPVLAKEARAVEEALKLGTTDQRKAMA